MPERTMFIDFFRFLCPVCAHHVSPRRLVDANLREGEMSTVVDVGGEDGRRATMEHFWPGKIVAPFSFVLKEKTFMGRKVWERWLMTIGSFDEYANYCFRKKLAEIVW